MADEEQGDEVHYAVSEGVGRAASSRVLARPMAAIVERLVPLEEAVEHLQVVNRSGDHSVSNASVGHATAGESPALGAAAHAHAHAQRVAVADDVADDDDALRQHLRVAGVQLVASPELRHVASTDSLSEHDDEPSSGTAAAAATVATVAEGSSSPHTPTLPSSPSPPHVHAHAHAQQRGGARTPAHRVAIQSSSSAVSVASRPQALRELQDTQRRLNSVLLPLSDDGSHYVVKVRVCTWNLCGSLPDAPLHELLPVGAYDVYAIGTQECERSIGQNLLNSSKDGWERILAAHMTPEYLSVRSHTLGGIHLSVFVRKRLLPLVSNVASAHVITGFANVIGNKGGVGISLRLLETSFLFVTAHFAAHQERVRERNEDYWRINLELALPPGRTGAAAVAAVTSPSSAAAAPSSASVSASAPVSAATRLAVPSATHGLPPPPPPPLPATPSAVAAPAQAEGVAASPAPPFSQPQALPTPSAVASYGSGSTPGRSRTTVSERFDRVFWFGDLNYRVNSNRGMADALIANDMLEVLLNNDQLRHEMCEGHVFRDYVEGEIRFAPTYKVDVGTLVYDTSPLQRVPAYTDRVLHRACEHITILEYDSARSVRASDHLPVFASYAVSVSTAASERTEAASRACALL